MLKKALSLVLALLMTFSMAMPALALELETVEDVVPTEDVHATEADPAAVADEETAEPLADGDTVMVEHNGTTTYYADLQKAFDGFAPSNNTYGGKYVVTLLADTTGVNKNLQYPTEVLDVTLDLNGKTITGDGSTVAVVINFGSKNSKDCVFTIKDSSGDNSGKITGGKGGVKVDGAGSVFNFQGGTITGNHNASKGGGIFMGAKTFLNMTGGVITGNSVKGSSSANTGYGGGVLVNYGTISGGVITGNTAYKGSHLQTGRGGGVCTEITRTTGYSTLTIADGVVYGNTAENAGDDVMAQGNGNVKYTFSIGTQGWYVDGWKGTKAGSGGGQTDRYNAENPVAYTDGGFTDVKNVTVGLKYVAPVVEEKAPEAPNVENADVSAYVFICNTKINLHQPVGITFDSQYSEAGEPFKNDAGEWNAEVTHRVKAMWENHTSALYAYNYPDCVHEPKEELPETITVTMKWDSENEKWVLDGEKTYFDISCKAPVARLESTGAEYETLQAALDAAKTALEGNSEAEKITLLADTVETVKLTWLRSKDITLTIDLAGYTVDGNGAGSVMTFGGATSYKGRFHIVIEDSSANKTGTVTGGKATSGGAIKLDGAKAGDSLTINGGNFVGNEATSTGGALYSAVVGARIYINGGNFANNTAKSGGAISAYSLEINGGIIKNNSATGDGTFSGRGGGIQMWGTGKLDFKMTGGVVVDNTASRYGDDIVICSTNNTPVVELLDAEKMGIEGINAWCIDGYNGAYGNEANLGARYNAENPVKFEGTIGKGIAVALKAATVIDTYTVTYTDGVEDEEIFADQVYTVKEGEATPAFEGTPSREGYVFVGWEPAVAETVTANEVYEAVWEKIPEAPDKYGKNVTTSLVRVICDTDEDHAPMTLKWQHQSTKVRDWVSGVVWSAEENTWVVPIRIDSISVYYVWAHFEDEYNDIIHELVPDAPIPEGKYHIDTYLKWDEEQELWVTLDEKPIDIHVSCKTEPDAPSAFQIKSYQVKVTGVVDGEEKVYFVYVDTANAVIGEIKGSREEGFTVDVTFNITEDDALQSGWIEKRDPEATVDDYIYDWSKTPESITITLYYTGNTTGNLYGSRTGDWALENGKTYGTIGEAYLIPAKPEAPSQDNVDGLITVICDSDPEHHAPVSGKWYPQNCKTMSEITWDAEKGVWTVDVRVDSIDWYYVHLALERAYNNTHHELASSNYVDTTLVWDADKGVWVPVETIEAHATCRTAPLAPSHNQLESYQVKVYGLVNGVEKAWTTSIPEGAYTIGEVKGSREEGFTVDVTFTIAEDDIYQNNWIEKRNPGKNYVYDWDRTPATVTYTLVYNGDLNGTLHGDRHASNTNYDWVLASNGSHYGVVAEAYLVQYANVVYTDGFDSTVVFEDQSHVVKVGEATPAFVGTPELYGFDFLGWDPAVSETVTDDVTYVAQWQLHAFTVTFDAGLGTVTPSAKGVLYGFTIGELPVPTLSGAEFLGWYVDGVKVDENYVVTADVTLTARWIAPEKEGHEWSEWKTEGGIKYRECKDCGIIERIYVGNTDKTDDESNPNTGAAVPSESAVSALAAMAVLGAAAFVLGKRK